MEDGIATEEEFAHFLGKTLDGRYRIDEILGTGGMGGVFRATHLGLKREVAVKILRPRFGDRGETAKRFEREAHSASGLDHENCVRVTDFGSTEDGGRYLVMQLLEGEELFDLLGSPWPPAKAVDLALQIFRGLAHAHQHGIVHRDLKPANVFVTYGDDGKATAKLVDFGIAKILNDNVFDEKLTRTGVIFGTPRYMSPEQASGGKVDERTDLYSAGLLLYQMLAGHPPFEGEGAATLLRQHVIAPPPPLPDGVPAPLRTLTMRLLEKLPSDRIKTANEVVSALESLGPSVEGVPAAHKVAAVLEATAASVPAASVPAAPVVAAPSPGRSSELAATSVSAVSGAFVKPGTAPGEELLPGSPTRPLAGLGAAARSPAAVTSPYGFDTDTTAAGHGASAHVTSPAVSRGGTLPAIQHNQAPRGPTPLWMVIALFGLFAFAGVFVAWLLVADDDAEAVDSNGEDADPGAGQNETRGGDESGAALPRPALSEQAVEASPATKPPKKKKPKKTKKKNDEKKGKGKGKGKGKKGKKPWEIDLE